MTTFDFAPLFRTAIGFDRLARLVDTASTTEATGYPPTTSRNWAMRKTIAADDGRGPVSSPEELDLVVKDNTLVISGRPAADTQKSMRCSIAASPDARSRARRFVLADHIVVDGADLNNGLLHVGLETRGARGAGKRPCRIAVNSSTPSVIANDTSETAKAA